MNSAHMHAQSSSAHLGHTSTTMHVGCTQCSTHKQHVDETSPSNLSFFYGSTESHNTTCLCTATLVLMGGQVRGGGREGLHCCINKECIEHVAPATSASHAPHARTHASTHTHTLKYNKSTLLQPAHIHLVVETTSLQTAAH